MAKYIEADADKVKFYSSVYGLGCINGGQEAFNYFNNKLQPGTPRIAEFDVMNHNLKKVFPDATTKFSEQDFFEFSQLYWRMYNIRNKNNKNNFYVKIYFSVL